MIQHDYYANKLWHGLALHRFHIHVEEVKRILSPILEEVYNLNIGLAEPEHTHRLCDETREEAEWQHTLEEKNVCEQSLPEQVELSEDTSSEN